MEELQKDFMRMDVVSKLGEAESEGDDKLKKAWETASLFKKRCLLFPLLHHVSHLLGGSLCSCSISRVC